MIPTGCFFITLPAKNDMEIRIRKGMYTDTNTITQFQIAMALETENFELDPRTVNQGVAAVLNNEQLGRYYVAESAGQVLGSLLTTYEWSDWRNGMILWIQSVYIRPEYRKMGVYTQLYRFIHDQVERDSGLCGIRLYVDKTNIPAQNVYARLGMNGEHYRVFEWMK